MPCDPRPGDSARRYFYTIVIRETKTTVRRLLWRKEPLLVSWVHQVKPHVFGHLPQGKLTLSVDAPRSQSKEIDVVK
jgi:xanthosine utilization system XapX-like protein